MRVVQFQMVAISWFGQLHASKRIHSAKENDNVNREGKTNDEIVRDWRMVRRLNAFDVAILKGEAPGNEGNAIFHRSTEIEAINEFRVLLRIDV